jgi:RimJ/RimL family protein N-acetyltransferase
MELHIAPLTEADARAVCAWRYEGEYAVYNVPDWDTVVAQRWGIADEAIRRREFCSLRDENGALIGFFRLHEQESCVLLSLGLAPQYCGKGLGQSAMALVLQEARRKAPGRRAELEVRAFNARAITCYEKCGFAVVDTYDKETPVGGDTFILMAMVL